MLLELPSGFPLPLRAGWGSHCRRTPRLSGWASAPALLSGPQAGGRQERETEDRGGEGETRKAEATRREGAGRDSGARFSTAPEDSAPRGPGRGGLGRGRPGVGYARERGLPSPGRGAGGRRAVSGGARSGWPGPCGAPGTAAAAEGHREEGASHGGAPRPPPASERDDEGGAAAARRAPAGSGGGGDGAAPPSPLPSAAPSPDAVRSQSLACNPRPPSGLESPIRPPHHHPTSSVWTWPGVALLQTGSRTLTSPPVRGISRAQVGPKRAQPSKALSLPERPGGWGSRLPSPLHSSGARGGRGSRRVSNSEPDPDECP